MYTTAINRGFSKEVSPENLNVLEIFFTFALSHMNKLLKSIEEGDNNWNDGYEGVLLKVYDGWNSAIENYEQKVLTHGKQFEPK